MSIVTLWWRLLLYVSEIQSNNKETIAKRSGFKQLFYSIKKWLSWLPEANLRIVFGNQRATNDDWDASRDKCFES